MKNHILLAKRGSNASPKLYNALRACGFQGVFLGVLEIQPGATEKELRSREYQLINHYKTSLNIKKEDISTGNISNGTEIPVIILNIKTWEERMFISYGAAARWLELSQQTISEAVKNHNITLGTYLIMKANAILSHKEFLKAISSKRSLPVIVTIIETGEKIEFSSQRKAAAFIGCSRTKLANALKHDPSIIIINNIKYQINKPPVKGVIIFPKFSFFIIRFRSGFLVLQLITKFFSTDFWLIIQIKN